MVARRVGAPKKGASPALGAKQHAAKRENRMLGIEKGVWRRNANIAQVWGGKPVTTEHCRTNKPANPDPCPLAARASPKKNNVFSFIS